jgi:hypothetical protein
MNRTKIAEKRKRGRLGAGRDPVSAVRLPADLTKEIDRWSEQDNCSRSEGIRRLIELGLTVSQGRRSASMSQSARAASLAGEQLDRMEDAGASIEERATRKHKLLNGPRASRESHKVRPK